MTIIKKAEKMFYKNSLFCLLSLIFLNGFADDALPYITINFSNDPTVVHNTNHELCLNDHLENEHLDEATRVIVVWFGLNNIQEIETEDCASDAIGAQVEDFLTSGSVRTYNNSVFAAERGQTRYFRCDLHCGAGAFSTFCPIRSNIAPSPPPGAPPQPPQAPFPPYSPPSESSSMSLGVIIGAAVGGGVALIVAIVCISNMCKQYLSV